ncbi:hypothetical protein DAC20_36 [Bacteroides phage DAC20]|nr:hypothetical protein DAC19_36 [Bacteroides phage DAC19]QIG63789.1 hypothetical protein DAC20_36 [Bacteroides phage DAC20]QIG64050.1 hypothetical protein DAC22_36 [Bacteroides phage DAC22]
MEEEFLDIIQKCSLVFMMVTAIFGFIFSIKKKIFEENICKILMLVFLIVFMITRIILNE